MRLPLKPALHFRLIGVLGTQATCGEHEHTLPLAADCEPSGQTEITCQEKQPESEVGTTVLVVVTFHITEVGNVVEWQQSGSLKLMITL